MFDKLYGIDDLENDINQFKLDIGREKQNYEIENEEYRKIASNFASTVEKYDYFQAQLQEITELFPEDVDIDAGDETLEKELAQGFGYAALALESVAIFAQLTKSFYAWRLTKVLARIDDIDGVMLNLAKIGRAADKFEDVSKLYRAAQMAKASKLSKIAKVSSAARVAKFLGAAGVILGIVGLAFELKAADQRRELLREHKRDLNTRLEEINGYITEANQDTKNLIEAFLGYFGALKIDVSGVFNTNKDGLIQNSEGLTPKFDDAVDTLRGALNSNIEGMGVLNSKLEEAKTLIIALIDNQPGDDPLAELLLDTFGSLQGSQLIKTVVKYKKLPEHIVQRLYIVELFNHNKSIKTAESDSGLPTNIVRGIYARNYLNAGKTVEDAAYLSNLPESIVREIYVSKLLDDQLNSENPNDVLDLQPIATKAKVSVEKVREIRLSKLATL